LIQFGTGDGRGWLRRVLPAVSSGARFEQFEPVRLNLAFTLGGLRALGLPESAITAFPEAFRAGMAARSEILGDVGLDAPLHWQFGSERAVLSALALLYATDAGALDTRLTQFRGLAERFGVGLEVQLTYLPADRCEHFGFRLGRDQPNFSGDGKPRGFGRRLPAGEFVLGYRSTHEHSTRLEVPLLRSTRPLPRVVGKRRLDFGFGGSFLVVRKLEQDVLAFRSLARRLADGPPGSPGVARLIGRWPNGAPLAAYPEAMPASWNELADFSYRALDPDGRRCPFGAHVRRANPRDSFDADPRSVDAHRLLRRSRVYGPRLAWTRASDDGHERGLLFLALSADLSRQFETVQGEWLNGPKFLGLRDEVDPLLGKDLVGEQGQVISRRFTLPGFPARQRVDLPRLVRVRGGLYAFVPSLRALGYLADCGSAR
jgi:deferrochelatase/peroxidase EfeB